LLIQRFNPINYQAASDWIPHSMIFDGLLNLTPKGREPALATDWSVSPDGRTLEFNLRRGVRFHNGDEFTAEDVKFTLEKIVSPESMHNAQKTWQGALKSVEILTPYKVRLQLKAPWAEFFNSIRAGGTQCIVPKKYYEEVGAKGFQRKPIGTGAFKLDEVKEGASTRYEANTDYWGQVPSVRYVTKRLVAEDFTRFAMVQRGEADIAMGLTGALLKRTQQNPDLRVIFARYHGTCIIGFNRHSNPEFKDRRVRLAVAYAVDRDAIARKILGGVCDVATQAFSPSTFGYEPSIDAIPYDPEKAKALLSEAGIKPGHKVDMSIHTQSFGSQPSAPEVLEAIAGYLEAVGFKINRIPLETGAWLSMMRAGKQTGIFYGPNSVPDDGGSFFSDWYTKRAWCGEPCDLGIPEYDRIMEEQIVEMDRDKRESTLRDWVKMERKRFEVMPLFWCHAPFVIGPRIKEWKPGLGSGYHMNLQTMTLGK
jgi:peptide/nickel transport system substrate-binding protein